MPQPEDDSPQAAVSYEGFALGMVLGLLMGLCLTWLLGPLRGSSAAPHQLRAENRHHYMAAIALEFMQGGDLDRAISRLAELRLPPDPIQAMAAAACELGSSGYLESSSGIAAVRAMTAFYQLQGRSGCADRLLPALQITSTQAVAAPRPTNAARLMPLPGKTPFPDARRTSRLTGAVATPIQRSFTAGLASTFCDPALPGIIEVAVVDLVGEGIPGQRIAVYWDDKESVFVSGLKTERGDDYADFEMETGVDYTIAMPGAAEPLEASLSAEPCLASGGVESRTSHRAVFRQTG